MEAGKWFIEDALVAPWSTQKDIGKIEKSGNQIITLSDDRSGWVVDQENLPLLVEDVIVPMVHICLEIA